MISPAAPKFSTVPRFTKIPWLVHGFGSKSFTLADLKTWPGWKTFSVVWMKQVHSNSVRFIDGPPESRLRGDALATDRSGLLLVVKTADCLPIFLVDDKKRVAAAVHCGWRGTAHRILEHVVSGLRERYDCDPAGLLAASGPCIGEACYEVGEDVRQAFREPRLPLVVFRRRPGRAGKYFLDLRGANRRQLIEAGLRPKNIFDVAACTYCDIRYHSYRRDKSAAGRLFNFIGIRAI
jgi:YfiH family protein